MLEEKAGARKQLRTRYEDNIKNNRKEGGCGLD
jgi:hypothetical protein